MLRVRHVNFFFKPRGVFRISITMGMTKNLQFLIEPLRTINESNSTNDENHHHLFSSMNFKVSFMSSLRPTEL